MKYINKSTKFQLHGNQALTANTRPSVSAPARSEPGFMADLKDSFESMLPLVRQLDLPLNSLEQATLFQTYNEMRKPRLPRPKPGPPIGQ